MSMTDKFKYVTNGNQWFPTEDLIVVYLRENTNLSIRDISKGLFNRTRSGVAGRVLYLRKKKLVR